MISHILSRRAFAAVNMAFLWLALGFSSTVQANPSSASHQDIVIPSGHPNSSYHDEASLRNAQNDPALKPLQNEHIWLRLPEPVKLMTLDPFHRKRLAYIEIRTGLLKTLHLPTKAIITIDGPGIDKGFIWAPDGIRLIYRKQFSQSGKVFSKLMVYDHYIHKHLTIHELPSYTGYPTLDPRDHQLLLVHQSGILQKRLKLPRSRLARWQMLKSERHGRFAATPKGIMHISPSQRGMIRLKDDGSGLQSYSISRDGLHVVWATKRRGIYLAKDSWNHNSPTPKLIAYGVDPTWTGNGKQILFAGARVIGNKIAGYDIRKIDIHGVGSWLTQSFSSQERWPISLPNHHILFTKERTTDIYSIQTQNHSQHFATNTPALAQPKTQPENQISKTTIEVVEVENVEDDIEETKTNITPNLQDPSLHKPVQNPLQKEELEDPISNSVLLEEILEKTEEDSEAKSQDTTEP